MHLDLLSNPITELFRLPEAQLGADAVSQTIPFSMINSRKLVNEFSRAYRTSSEVYFSSDRFGY